MKKAEMTNLEIVKNYLEEKMVKMKYPHYMHDNKLFFLNEDDELNEIDMSILELKMQLKTDIKDFLDELNTDIEFDFYSKPCTDRIIPVLVTTDELKDKGNIIRNEKMDNGNFVTFIDTYLGDEGRYTNRGELDAYKSLLSISISNLCKHFSSDVIFEEIMTDSQVFKLIEPIHGGFGRSIMLIPNVQNKIKQLFGDKAYIIVSDRGYMYACNFLMCHSDIITTLFQGPQQHLENHFDIFTFINGIYQKCGSGFRELAVIL
jgi:hypothetical protein